MNSSSIGHQQANSRFTDAIHYFDDEKDVVGDRVNIRHNSQSAVTALKNLFYKFVKNHDCDDISQKPNC